MCDMENPTFHLEGIVKDKNELQDFSGPLSLILMLLSKNKIEIRDIKISEILDQYLEYLAEMERMDLEIASEFVQMAQNTGQRESSLPCWTMQNGRTSIRLSSVP